MRLISGRNEVSILRSSFTRLMESIALDQAVSEGRGWGAQMEALSDAAGGRRAEGTESKRGTNGLVEAESMA